MGWGGGIQSTSPLRSRGVWPLFLLQPEALPSYFIAVAPLTSKPEYVCASLKKLKQTKIQTEGEALTLQHAGLGGSSPRDFSRRASCPASELGRQGQTAPLKRHQEPGPGASPPRFPPCSLLAGAGDGCRQDRTPAPALASTLHRASGCYRWAAGRRLLGASLFYTVLPLLHSGGLPAAAGSLNGQKPALSSALVQDEGTDPG